MADKIEIPIEFDRLQLFLNNAFQKADSESKGKLTQPELQKGIIFFAEEAKVTVASDNAVESCIRSTFTVDLNSFQNIIENLYQIKPVPSTTSDGTPKSQNTPEESAQKTQFTSDKPDNVVKKESSRPSKSETTEESNSSSPISSKDQTSSQPTPPSQSNPVHQPKVSNPSEEAKPTSTQHLQHISDEPIKPHIEQSKPISQDIHAKSTSEKLDNKSAKSQQTTDSKCAAGTEQSSQSSQDLTKDSANISKAPISSCQDILVMPHHEIIKYEPKSTETYEDIYKFVPEGHLPHSVSTPGDLLKEYEEEGYSATTALTSHRSLPAHMEELAVYELSDLSQPLTDSDHKDAGKDNIYMISFSIPYETTPQQKIVVVGSHDMFGNWDPQKGIQLEWHSENEWKATVQIAEEKLPEIEYKYVCIHPNGVRWEEGQNRKLIPSSGEPKAEKLYFDRSELWQDLIN